MKPNWNRSLKIVMFVVVALAASSLAVMVLWNWLVPTVFGLPMIRFWQALGLLVLSKILFGRSWGPRRRHWPRRMKSHEHDGQGDSQ